jgi:hypothetical protein
VSTDDITLSREKLRMGKYTRAYARLTSDELEGLLWLLGEWSVRRDGGHPRADVALEALRNFSHEPLTLEEVYPLMRAAKRR